MSEPHPRLSARDLAGPVALFLGTVLLVIAIGAGPLIGPKLTKVPLTVDQTWVSDGSDGTRILDRCSLERDRARIAEATVHQQRRILAVRPADAQVVTLQAGTALTVEHLREGGRTVKPSCDEPTIAAVLDRVTLDRRTAAPTGTSGIQYDDEHAAVTIPDRRGYTYLLPYGFDPAGAHYFDPVTRQSLPMTAKGTQTMGGREVTHFVVDVPETDLSEAQQDPRAVIVKPASWFGTFPGVRPGERLTATLRHRATLELYVDTTTGVLIAERAVVNEVYRFTAESARTPALRAFELTGVDTTLWSDEQTIREAAEDATHRARTVALATRIVPIVAGILGAALLALGTWLGLRRRPAETRVTGTRETSVDT